MIEIKIAGNSAAEALADLAELAKLVGLTEAPAKKQSKPEPPPESVRERPTLSEVPEPTAEAAPEPEPEAPAGDWEPGGGASVEEPIPAGPTFTREEIRRAGIDAAKAHGKSAVQDILQGFGVRGMTELTPEQFPEFMRKLGELNAE